MKILYDQAQFVLDFIFFVFLQHSDMACENIFCVKTYSFDKISSGYTYYIIIYIIHKYG